MTANPGASSTVAMHTLLGIMVGPMKQADIYAQRMMYMQKAAIRLGACLLVRSYCFICPPRKTAVHALPECALKQFKLL